MLIREVGGYLRPVHGYDPCLVKTGFCIRLENVCEKPLYFPPILLVKTGDSAVIRYLIGRRYFQIQYWLTQ